jgi:hypothetical protein
MEKILTVELAASYSWAGVFCVANSTSVKNVKKPFLGAYPKDVNLIVKTLDKFVRQSSGGSWLWAGGALPH